MGLFFGTPVTPEQRLREQDRELLRLTNGMKRAIDKEIDEARMDFNDGLNALRAGDMLTARQLAQSNADHALNAARMRGLMAHINRIRAGVMHTGAVVGVTRSLVAVARITAMVNRRVDLPEFTALMQRYNIDLSKLTFKMETAGGVMADAGDTADSVYMDDVDEEMPTADNVFATMDAHVNGVALPTALPKAKKAVKDAKPPPKPPPPSHAGTAPPVVEAHDGTTWETLEISSDTEREELPVVPACDLIDKGKAKQVALPAV